jgi:adenosine kinase
MKDKILVIGSLAFDHVMEYEGFFKDVIVPDNFNLTVTANSRLINFGGCGGNISYSLRLLNEKPVLMTCAGFDFGQYEDHLKKIGIDVDCVYKSKLYPTASAFIVTDKDHNQITIFEPGAMHAEEDHASLKNTNVDAISLAIISPDHPKRMLKMAVECSLNGIPFIFDPAQQINVFENEDLLAIAKKAGYLILNEYEAALVQKKLGISYDEMVALAPVYIETRGKKGGVVYGNGERLLYPAVIPDTFLDPTGCGDAFRSGLLCGLRRGYDILKACKVGALTATYSLEYAATQTHEFTSDEFSERFRKSFGENLE